MNTWPTSAIQAFTRRTEHLHGPYGFEAFQIGGRPDDAKRRVRQSRSENIGIAHGDFGCVPAMACEGCACAGVRVRNETQPCRLADFGTQNENVAACAGRGTPGMRLCCVDLVTGLDPHAEECGVGMLDRIQVTNDRGDAANGP
jgi:hypothetical protein